MQKTTRQIFRKIYNLPIIPGVKKRLRAFSLTEVLLSLILLLALGVMVAVTLGTSARSNQQAGGFLMARTLVASKLSQLQSVGYENLNGPALGQGGARIVDGSPTSPTALENVNGAASGTFSFTETNQLATYFPNNNGSTDARGRIFLAPYAPARQTTASGDRYPLIRATIEVQWRDSNGVAHTYSETTLIPRNRL